MDYRLGSLVAYRKPLGAGRLGLAGLLCEVLSHEDLFPASFPLPRNPQEAVRGAEGGVGSRPIPREPTWDQGKADGARPWIPPKP